MVTRPDIGHAVQYARDSIAGMLVDSAVVERPVPGERPAPGYPARTTSEPVGTLNCRFPVPIPGSVLGQVPGVALDVIQRRYGMLVVQDTPIREGDRVTSVTDLTGRVLNLRAMKVDAVVLRSSHALIVLEEYV